MRHSTMRTAAVLGAGALLLAACGGGGNDQGDNGSGDGGDVSLVWWHNTTQEPLRSWNEEKAAEFTEQTGIKVEVVPVQNEDFETKLQIAMQSDETPDIFQQWGGGALATQVASGKVMDITDATKDLVAEIGGSAAGWQVDGKQYGIPMGVGVMGFWYNTELFDQAGITNLPTTMAELETVIGQLQDAGITPISLGAQDQWPAAQYYYATAVRECSTEVMQSAVTSFDFTDPCWIKAGEAIQDLVELEPFQVGFLATSAQQGAGSSAGMLANGQVAMEYMGHWQPLVVADLAEDADAIKSKLGWFAFPQIEGGDGDPLAIVGGGDGFSCAADAPKECVDFIKFMASEEVQREWAELDAGLPVLPAAADGVKDVNLQQLLDYRNEATFVQLYLDQAYGPNVGGALNEAVTNLFAGTATPQDVVDAMTAAAENN